MDNNILSTIRTSKGFSRSIVMLITLALLGVMLERTIYYTLNETGVIEDENIAERIKRIAPHEARRLGLANKTKYTPQPASDESRFSATVQNIKEKLAALDNPYERVDTEILADQISEMRNDLNALNTKVKAGFAKTLEHIEQNNLPALIVQRHTDAVAQYNEKFNTLKHKLLAIELAPTVDAKKIKLTEAKNWLSEQKFKRSQQAFDPDNLPFKSAQPNPDNKPKLSNESFTSNGYFSSPNVQLAALGGFTFSNLPGANNPAFLAATDEILLTQAIKDQAALLNYDPVKIYNWVRNTIEWQPAWGAVQNAELTLAAKRGNAMDIASLTIALFRASQIPARYVHGTIEIPEAEFRNWAGGFSSIEAAVNFSASGGIPTGAVVSGGKIDSVQIEHIWVEIAADYFPSRAAKNIDADSWVQIDPSFKQYDYLPGLDVVQISGIDTAQLAQDVLNSGTVNEQEGWVTGFDPTIIQTAQAQAQTALTDHINNNLTNPTVGDVIGGRKTIIQQHTTLADSLANNIVASGVRYGKLPASLQQSVSYTFVQNAGSQFNTPASFAWSRVNNEKVTLSFKPATDADNQALQSLLPDNITDISQLPTSIPAYLIKVVPELKLNGELKLTGSAMNLGSELVFKTSITHPGRSSQINYTYKIPAGSYVSVNTIAGNVSADKLTALQAQLTQTKNILQSNDPAQIQNLTRETILGDMFYTGTLGYFAQLIGFNQIGALQAKAQYYLSAGYGTFGYEPKVDFLFGIPNSIQAGGVTLDIPVNIVTANNAGDKEKQKQLILQSGIILSTLEHATPEQLFNIDPANPPNAFSAVKGLQIASAEGQRIYQISQANVSSVMPNINLDAGSEAEILQAINAGKEVITHTDPVNVPGYTGAGYIIFDPLTGDGAYRISGGQNGAWFSGTILGTALGLLIFVLINSPAALGVFSAEAFLVAAVAMLALTFALNATWQLIGGDKSQSCFLGGFLAGISMTVIVLKFPDLLGRVLSAIGLGASQADLVGSSARTCGVI